jgi:hypothetical protein
LTARASAGSADADGAAARRRPSPEALADVVASVLLLALFAWAFVAADEWSYRAALFPRLVTAAGIVLTALHLAQVLLRIRRPVPPGADDEPDGDPHDVEYVFRTAGPRRWAAALGWVAAFFALLHVVGLYPTAAIFPLLYLRFAGGRTWIFSAIYAIVSAVVLYVSFELALGVPTPTGLLLD